jgi:hypothetical protein
MFPLVEEMFLSVEGMPVITPCTIMRMAEAIQGQRKSLLLQDRMAMFL